MADIFDEIDEDLKRDRAQELWARYGKFVIAAAAAVVLAVGSLQGYKTWTQSRAESAANAYQAALASESVVAALDATLPELTDGYAMRAQFRIAGEKAAAGDLADAETGYLALSKDKSIAPLYQQAALLLSVMSAPAEADTKELQDRLAPLVFAAGPWQGLAMELSAALDLKTGDRAAAMSKIESLLTLPEISPELRQRANQLLIILKS
ncbi:MAG: tetratricopeptide repeat protein [Alphaproteobacteria bacterium]